MIKPLVEKIKISIGNMKLNHKIQISLILIIVPLFILFVMLFSSVYSYNDQYNDIVDNAAQAGKFSINFKEDFDYKVYLIIAGHSEFAEEDPYSTIDDARSITESLRDNTTIAENRDRAESILRLLDNLDKYVRNIEQNKLEGGHYDDNIHIWEDDVQIVTALIQKMVLEYTYYETSNIEQYKDQISSGLNRITLIGAIIFGVIILGAMVLSIIIPNSITRPIRNLNDTMADVAKRLSPIEGMLEEGQKYNLHRIAIPRNDELGKISKSFNKMADTIYVLVNNLEETVKERTAQLEENKEKLQLILDSTAEAIFGVDSEGKCTFCNASCIKMLGYSSQHDLLGKNIHQQIHYSRIDNTIIAEDECRIMQALEHGTSSYSGEEVFWRADGTSFAVEYYSYPQFQDGNTIGAVVTFIDNTERKKAEYQIKYLSSHDALTGLYNRAYFDDALKQIDTKRNLPISIIFCDVNGLKLTNDVFGHAAGDALIKKSAEIIKRVCRQEDIVARLGGDELIILLANTEAEDAAKIIMRVKSELYNEQIEAIRCSISMGLATKTQSNQIIDRTMLDAEHAMYVDKIANRKAVNSDMIDTIIQTLHERSPHEKSHSDAVSKWCKAIGKAMGLSEAEIRKLSQAGYMHDIGKIVMDKDLLIRYGVRTNDEKKEVQRHAMVGYRILNLFDDTLDLANEVYYHHENWDGSGYPKGLKGGEIPLIARIIAVAEAYDAMTSVMYEEPMDKRSALREIKKLSGVKFDPGVVDVFVEMMSAAGQ